jgi:hypothetical protein
MGKNGNGHGKNKALKWIALGVFLCLAWYAMKRATTRETYDKCEDNPPISGYAPLPGNLKYLNKWHSTSSYPRPLATMYQGPETASAIRPEPYYYHTIGGVQRRVYPAAVQLTHYKDMQWRILEVEWKYGGNMEYTKRVFVWIVNACNSCHSSCNSKCNGYDKKQSFLVDIWGGSSEVRDFLIRRGASVADFGCKPIRCRWVGTKRPGSGTFTSSMLNEKYNYFMCRCKTSNCKPDYNQVYRKRTDLEGCKKAWQ